MEKLKYKQSILITTEYVEALALYCFCEYNGLDFKKEIAKRKKENLNNFPDFFLNDRYLEVVRAIEETEGKQQKDIADVFGKKNAEIAVLNKNNELKKYTGDKDHHIIFGIYRGVAYAYHPLKKFDASKKDIEHAISLKYEKYKNRLIDKPTDLFVVSYSVLNKEIVDDIYKWYKNDMTSNFFSSVYILYVSNECEKFSVVKMNRENIFNKQITPVDKNELAELIFDLGWLNKNKYVI